MNTGDNNVPTGAAGTIQKLTRLLAAPTIEPGQRATRIQTVERDIVLPLRALIIGILTYFFFFSGWFYTSGSAGHQIAVTNRPASTQTNSTRPAGTNSLHAARNEQGFNQPQLDDWSLRHSGQIKTCFLIYTALNILAGMILIWVPHLSLKKIEAMVFSIGVLDALLMGTLTMVGRGFDSALYYVFPVLILHNALAIPVALPQLLLNFLFSTAFMIGGILDKVSIATGDMNDPENLRVEKPVERLTVLVAWALCCYGIQVLFEKQKLAEAEATELAVRQERLHTAGRLAAEIAHQIKNPLGIITNAAFSLQRAIHEGKPRSMSTS